MMNNKGNATVLAVAVCMSLILIMCVIFEYIQMLVICNGIKNAVQSATVSVVVANYDDAYSQLREGYSGGYTYIDSAFTETIDTGNIYARLDELLALTEDGDKHTKYNGTVMVDVEIPVRFGGRELVPIQFTMKVKAEYVPKF